MIKKIADIVFENGHFYLYKDKANLVNKQKNTYLNINYRDHWHLIDDRDRDMKSKNTFAVMQMLMSMAKDGSSGMAPLISIGN
jgi:hypothetical protein